MSDHIVINKLQPMATKRKYSPLWYHFVEVAPKKAKCLYCSRTLAVSSSSIGSLGRHMKAVHPTVEINMSRHISDMDDGNETGVLLIPISKEEDNKSITSDTTSASARRKQFTTMADYIVLEKPLHMVTKVKRSPLWNHFKEVKPKKAKCLYCSRILAVSSSSNGSLSRHMKAVHPTVEIKMSMHIPDMDDGNETESLLIPISQEEDKTLITSDTTSSSARRKQSTTMADCTVLNKPLHMVTKGKNSLLWNHFEEVEPKKAKCLHCLQILAVSSSSIGTLSRHMKFVHPTVELNMSMHIPDMDDGNETESHLIPFSQEEDNTSTTSDTTSASDKSKQSINMSDNIVINKPLPMVTKRKHSPLWNHFEKVEPKNAKCLYCSRILAVSSSSIGTLSRHMKFVHPTVEINIGCQTPDREECNEAETIMIPVIQEEDNKSTTSDISMADNMEVQAPLPLNDQQLDEQLIKMIAKGYHALSLVDEKEFRKFIEMLNPGYTLPTRKTLLESMLPKVYNNILDSAKIQLKKASAICITTNSWTSIVNGGYIAITAHFIDEEKNQLCSVMLGCLNIEDSTSANLSDLLNEKFDEWNISHLVVVIVSDNEANILGAVRLSGWRSLSCFEHILNLVVQSGLIKITTTISKVKQIVEYFHESKPGAKKLNEIQEQMNISHLKLKKDVVTRWYSTYDMLDRVLELKDAIIASLALARPDLALLQEDWLVIENAIPVLKIFYEVTKEISSENYVSASKYIVFCKLISKQLQNLESYSSFTHKSVQDMVQTLKTQLKQRFGEVETNILLCESTILDPRFKKNGFCNQNNFERAAASLKLKLGKLGIKEEAPEPAAAADPLTHAGSIWEEFDTEVYKQVPQNPFAAGIVEFDKYMQEPLIKRNENPLQWWKERKSIYPHLYAFMLKRLTITATSVPCERLFSKAGLILSDKRTRLTKSKLSQLMFISCN